MKVTGLLASYTTRFDPTNTNRMKNIQLAVQTLDGYLLAPGEVFSFNAAVGPRTPEAGYVEALVIENQEFVPGVGGGVCQVSTTLYNAVLRADLEVVERRQHSRRVHYVPCGADATVSDYFIDLKFKNNTSAYVVIKSMTTPGRVTFKLFGYHEMAPRVDLESIMEEEIPYETKEIEDPTLPQGKVLVEKEGGFGCRVRVVRRVTFPDGGYRAETISQDFYPPEMRQVRIGSGPPTEGESAAQGEISSEGTELPPIH
jgi:vancomycin resistance protein YoaR